MSGAALYLHLVSDQRERARWLLRTRKAALLALLLSGSPDALAVRQEGVYGSERHDREEAA